ncbi:MAG: U32 family peptidase [Phycisphaerae bacterium]
MNKSIELLAPAKDSATAIAAIKCGADAVYIGPQRFGAREDAGNSIDSIKQTVDFAHQYYAKVYATVNTLLFDNELPIAEKLINQLYEAAIDGLIIQDAGLLELDLPPLPLIASTQMNNSTPEIVKFRQDVGFSRVILARELTLEQIKKIRSQTSIELECFIHGSLCVGQSGQCYMSYAIGGRSGNRGQCAQPCRRLYSLKDNTGKVIIENKYLLSLKDLNLSEHLEDLIDAGVTSFKIEGRLKDISYVINTVGFYRRKLDEILTKKNLLKSSSGEISLNFEPNLQKSFNRGYTDYGLKKRNSKFGSIDTPKSKGEFIGTVKGVGKDYFTLESRIPLRNADGICFFDADGNLSGTVINRVDNGKIYSQKIFNITQGQKIYRNFDYEFDRKLSSNPAQRKIDISIALEEINQKLIVSAKDQDGNEAAVEIIADKQPAEKKEAARQTIITQLSKMGNTIFKCSRVEIKTKDDYFLPVSKLNNARRELIEKLIAVRETNRPRASGKILKNSTRFPKTQLSYLGNISNKKAEAFYRRHGVEKIEPAAEINRVADMSGRLVMTTKYCLREELGLCTGKNPKKPAEPIILTDEDGRGYSIKFLCGNCGMEIVGES